jgi:ABC-type bacteriocin/lantibiotic exporter with double-glycine peptidase domain
MAAAGSERRTPWLRQALRPVRGALREVLAVSVFTNLLAIAAPVFVLQVYDRVVAHAGIATLYGLVAGMAMAIALDFVLRQTRARLLQDVALRLDIDVGRRLFETVLALPLRTLESRPGAYWRSLFRDVDTVRNLFSGATAVLVADLPFALLFAAIIVVIATPVAWVLLILLPAFAILGWVCARLVGAAGEREKRAGMGRDAGLAEMIGSAVAVKALDMDAAFRRRWEERHAEALESAVRRGGRADVFLNLGTGLAVATTVAITAVGAVAILDQRLSIGALIAANMLAARIIAPFQQITMLWRSYAAAREASARLGEAFSLATETAESPVALTRPKGAVTVDGVTFRYAEDGPPLIDDVKLHFDPCGLYGVVGTNGCGKTTLLKLAVGLYAPAEGRVLVDGTDIAQLSRAQRARWLGYVPQDAALVSGTVRDNIARGRDDIDDEAVIRAATLAGVHGYIVGLPDGYGAEVGEAGARLSAGIRQRIAIARALVGDPPVIVMDEPSSNLDHDAERTLAETLAMLARDHTVIVATHSTTLLSACHSLLVLERGRARRAGATKDVLPRLATGGGAAGAAS